MVQYVDSWSKKKYSLAISSGEILQGQVQYSSLGLFTVRHLEIDFISTDVNNYVSLHVHGRDLTLWLNSFPVVWQSFTIKCVKLHSFPTPEVYLFITNTCSDLCSVQTTTVSTLRGHNLGLNLYNPLMCTERRQWEKLDPRCPLAQVQLHQYPVLIAQIRYIWAVCWHISCLPLEQWLSSRRFLIYKVFSETLLCAQIMQGLCKDCRL